MTEDIIARIDEAVGCQQCRKSLKPDGPSPDFCSEDCQRKWMAKRAHQLPKLEDDGGRPTIHPAGRALEVERIAEVFEVPLELVVEQCPHVELDEIPHGWLSRWFGRHR